MIKKATKFNYFSAFILAILVIFATIFSFGLIRMSANTNAKQAFSASSATLYLEGTNDIPTNKTGEVTLSLKLNNPERKKVFGVECQIKYDNTCMTFTSGKVNPTGWSGGINYFESGGFINIPISAGDSSTQVSDATITLATLKFNIKTPTAQVYPFTFEGVDVSGMDPTYISIPTTGETFNLTFREPSSDASAKTVSVKNGTSEVGSYDAATKTYSATVLYGVSKVNVAVAANNANATVSGNGDFNLTAGTENTKTVTITAEDKTTKETITIKITREKGNSNAAINTIILKDSSGTQIPLTTSGTTYSTTISSSQSTGLTLTASARETTSSVTINNAVPTNYALNLKNGENQIAIKVTAQDGTVQNYVVKINVLSSNANLGTISLKSASGNEIALTESGTTYSAKVSANESSGLTLTATAQDSNAAITIDGGAATNHALTLTTGANEIEVKVTAEDSTEQIYKVIVTVESASTIDPDDPKPPITSGDGYIKIGGDFDVSITNEEFASTNDNLIKDVLVESGRVVFYIDAKSNFTFSVFYNNNFLTDKTEKLANGNVRHSFKINEVNENNNSLIVQITDTTTGASKLYVLNMNVKNSQNVQDTNKLTTQLVIAIIISVGVVLLIACIIIGLAIKKLNNASRLFDKSND